jgi:hypothetical protein
MGDEPRNDRMERLRELWRQRDEHWDAQQYAEFAATSDQLIALLEALRAEWEPQGQWTPDLQNDLARAHRGRGVAAYYLGESVEAQIAYYDEAIRLRESLDLSVAQHRNDLASALNNKGTALHALGTPQALAAAVVAYDEAIRLGEALDLSVAEYRNALASAHYNKGNALQVLGTPKDLAAAVVAYDQAIRLGESLDLSVAQYRNALARTHNNKGNALYALGTPKNLAAAIAAYDQIFRLCESLDLSVAEYRNALANAHNNKGIALRALGTPKDLAAAIAAYDQAIRLYESLDLSVAEYRNALARTHNNKGNALHALGTPQAQVAAVAAYDEAIRLGESLDLSVAEYRNALANAHDYKGNALEALGTPKDLIAAADAYDEAIRLGETLDLKVESCRRSLIGTYTNKGNSPILSPQTALDLFQKAIDLADGGRGLSITGIEFTAKAYRGAANAYLRLADPVNAADAADEGLSLLRELEIQGVFKLRSLREDLFAITLDAYVQAQQFQWMPEIIREHLDPDQRGSAPASEAMHAAALRALIQSLMVLYQTPRTAVAVADLLADLETLATQLAGWRTRYFSGEASSAWLRAQDCEKRGRPEQAEQILHAYIQARPLDPCGPKVLGDLYAQRRQPAAAEAAYRDAVRVCARGTPPPKTTCTPAASALLPSPVACSTCACCN